MLNCCLGQTSDKAIRAIRTALSKPSSTVRRNIPAPYARHWKSLKLVNGVVCCIKSDRAIAVISHEMMVEAVLVFHLSLAHAGREKLLHALASQVWHPKVAQIAADVTRTCHQCQLVKVSNTKIKPPTIKIETSQPFELVAVDLVALPPSSGRYNCCLVAVDHNSKWLSVVPLMNKRADTVTAAMYEVVLPGLPRVPQRILSDNGPEFRSQLFNAWLEEVGIEHVSTTPLSPSSNGAVERCNRTLIESLRNLLSTPSDWATKIPKAVITYNHTLHKELGMSPSEYLLTKSHVTDGPPPAVSTESSYWKEGHPSFAPFKPGQKVLRRVRFTGNCVVDKLSDRYEGPFLVKEVNLNRVTYRVEHCKTGKEVREHYRHLKPYKEPPEYLESHPYFQSMYGTDGSDLIDTPEFYPSGTEPEPDTFYINGADTSADSEGSETIEAMPSTVSSSSLNISSGEEACPGRKRTRNVDVFSRIGTTEKDLINSWLFHRGLSTVKPGTRSVPFGTSGSERVAEILSRPRMSSTPIGGLDTNELSAHRDLINNSYSSDLSITLAASLDKPKSENGLDSDAAYQQTPGSSDESLRLHLSSSLVHTDGKEHRVYTHLNTVPESVEQTVTQIWGDQASTTQRRLTMDNPIEKVFRLGNRKIRLIDPPKHDRSPVQTRSRGNVPSLPNVQQRTLEYVRY